MTEIQGDRPTHPAPHTKAHSHSWFCGSGSSAALCYGSVQGYGGWCRPRLLLVLAIGPFYCRFLLSSFLLFNPKVVNQLHEVIRLHGGLFQFCWIVGSTLKRLATAEGETPFRCAGAQCTLSNNSRVRVFHFYLLEFCKLRAAVAGLPPVVRCNFLRAGAEADRAAR